MAKNIDALLYDADLIHDAETESFNSAERVGQMFIDIIEHLRDVSDHNGSGGSGGDVPSGLYGSLISSLWTKSNPGSLVEGETGKILEWNGSAWQYSSTPTGGGGTPGTGGLAWSDLAANDGALPSTKQIDGSHLLNALSGYLPISELTKQNSKFTWWGQQMQKISNDYVVKGAMINVDSITFTNNIKLTPEERNGQYYLKLSYAGDGTTIAHFYATGGVSALGIGGNGSSDGGDGTGVELAGILKHISENDNNNYSSIVPTEGATIRWGGNSTKWVVDKTAITDIAGIPTPSTGYLKATVSGNNPPVYSWVDITPGTGNIDHLYDIGDVTNNNYPGYNSNRSDKTGILTWLTDAQKWGFLEFNIAGTGIGTTKTLSSITFANTIYNVPEAYSLPNATTSTKGGVIVGTGLSVNSGTLSVNTGFSESDKNYAVKAYSGTGTNAGKLYVTVPWTDTNTTYSAGSGLTGTTTFSVLRDGDNNSGLSVSSSGVKVLLNSTNPGLSLTGGLAVKVKDGGGLAVDGDGLKISSSRTLWGNTDYLTNDLGKSGDNKSLDYVQNISMYGGVVMNSKNSQIQMSDPAGTTRNVLNLTDKDQKDVYYGNTLKAFLDVGYGCARVTTGDNKSVLRLWGNDIIFKADGSDGNKNIMILTKEGSTYLPLATTGPKSGNTYTGAGPAAGLRIGDAVLYWDEANQALALAKYNTSQPSSPTAANFYATGGVSALGMSPGISSIDAMTFGNLTVTDSIDVANKIVFDSDYEDDVYIKSTSSQLHLSSLDYIYLDTPVYNISIGNGSTISGIRVGTGNKLVFTIDGSEYNVSYTQ